MKYLLSLILFLSGCSLRANYPVQYGDCVKVRKETVSYFYSRVCEGAILKVTDMEDDVAVGQPYYKSVRQGCPVVLHLKEVKRDDLVACPADF